MKPIARRKSRWPLRAVLCMLLGAPVTWLIAWACAAVRPGDNSPNVFGTAPDQWSHSTFVPRFRQMTASGEVDIRIYGTSVSTLAYIKPVADVGLNTYPSKLAPQPRDRPPTNFVAALPAWASLPADGTDEVCAMTILWGWPARCLGGTTFCGILPGANGGSLGNATARGLVGSRPLPFTYTHKDYWDRSSTWTSGRIRLLPLRPIWPGFLLNTAFYSITLFFILTLSSLAYRSFRARRRRRRGLCPQCAYNLAATLPGAPCPECGTPAPTNRVQPRIKSAPRPVRTIHLAVISILLSVPATWLATWTMAAIRPAHSGSNLFGTPPEQWRHRAVFPKFSERTSNGEILAEITGTPVSTVARLSPGDPTRNNPGFPRPALNGLAGNPDWPPVSSWVIPPWSCLPPNPKNGQPATTTAWGWPFRCLSGVDHQTFKLPARGTFTAFDLTHSYEDFWQHPFGSTASGISMLPLRPIWSGLILNSILYSIFIFALLSFSAFSYRSLRARRRHRRGLCPHCAYNLAATPAGTPCPECGASPRSPSRA